MHATIRKLLPLTLLACMLGSAVAQPPPYGGFSGRSFGDRGSYGGPSGYSGSSGYSGYRSGDYGGFRGFPGSYGGGPPGGGMFFGGDPREMVRRADSNNNNTLEREELESGYGRPVRFMAERAGLNVSQSLRVDEVVAAIERMRGGSSSTSSTGSSAATTNPQGFGTTTQAALVPGFDGSTTTASNSPANIPLEQRFEPRVLDRAKERIRELDRNGNGTLEGEELANYRGDPPIMMSDLNKDNAISLEEMCYRYQARYGGYSYGGPGMPGGPPGYPGSTPSSPSSSGYRPPFMTSAASALPSPIPGVAPPPASTSSSSSSGSDRVREFAERIIKSNDRNNSGKLERDEWGSVRDPDSTDANRDGLITLDEMVARMQSRMSGGDRGPGGPPMFGGGPPGSFGDRGGFSGPPGGFGDRGYGDRGSYSRDFRGGDSRGGDPRGGDSRGGDSRGGDPRSSDPRSGSTSTSSSAPGSGSDPSAPKRSYRMSTPTELLPKNLDSWFTRSDADGDGQVSMSEYAAKWDPDVAKRFQGLDANSDGFISAAEALQAAPSSSSRR